MKFNIQSIIKQAIPVVVTLGVLKIGTEQNVPLLKDIAMYLRP